MAQAGYTPILIYASGTATNIPTAGNLISGSSGAELAINYADGKLYYKDGSGNVKLLSIGYGSSSVTPTNGGVQYGTGTALALTAAGSSGQILRSNGAAAPTWADLSTLGVNTISFGTTGLTPNSATAGAVTVAGTLVTANGGTGLGGASPFTANGVLYASSASALTSGSALTFDGSVLGLNNAGDSDFKLTTNNTGSGSTDGLLLRINSTGSEAYLWNWESGSSLIFGTSGTEQMRLNSTGLGIGTSSPSTKLQVNGNVYLGGAARNIYADNGSGIFFNGLNNFGSGIYSDGSGTALKFQTSSTDRMTLDSSGNLGLGVTPSAWSGFRAMQIGGTTSLWSTTSGNGSSFYTNNGYFNGSSRIYLTSGYATEYIQGQGQHIWYTAPSGTAGNAITFSQAMTLDASGNLGIGTSSPAVQIDANKGGFAYSGNLYLTGKFTDGTAALKGVGLGYDNTSQTGIIYAFTGSAASNLSFWTYPGSGSATERMRLDSFGNLGLGVTPSAWASGTYRALQIGSRASFVQGASDTYVGNNWINDGTNKYIATAAASLYGQVSGAHQWYTAPSGTAGNAITFTQALTLDASGALLVGDTTVPSNGIVNAAVSTKGQGTSGSRRATASEMGVTASLAQNATANTYSFGGYGGYGLFVAEGSDPNAAWRSAAIVWSTGAALTILNLGSNNITVGSSGTTITVQNTSASSQAISWSMLVLG